VCGKNLECVLCVTNSHHLKTTSSQNRGEGLSQGFRVFDY
jgi:hypothetical protein